METLSRANLEQLFLGRLRRLARLQRLAYGSLEHQLVLKAIASTYRDCRALGMAAEARQNFNTERQDRRGG